MTTKKRVPWDSKLPRFASASANEDDDSSIGYYMAQAHPGRKYYIQTWHGPAPAEIQATMQPIHAFKVRAHDPECVVWAVAE